MADGFRLFFYNKWRQRNIIYSETFCFGESSNSNKTVTQLNAMTEPRSLEPLPMMPNIRVTTL